MIGRDDSPGDRVALAERWLDEHPDAGLVDRACFAVLIASGGDETNRPSWNEVAAVIDEDVFEVTAVLMKLAAGEA